MMSVAIELNPTQSIDLSAVKFTHEQFEEVCQTNRDLRLELSSTGELIVLAPTGWGSSKRNLKLIIQVGIWNERSQLGEAFESSGGFILPNGARRAPDVAWVEKSRIEALNPDPDKFLPLAPDFLIELRSATDSLPKLQQKMLEYQANGVRLGWLINPQNRQVEIYRSNGDLETLADPIQLSREDILPGFILDLTNIW
jgi:Uma2 family endonuclease